MTTSPWREPLGLCCRHTELLCQQLPGTVQSSRGCEGRRWCSPFTRCWTELCQVYLRHSGTNTNKTWILEQDDERGCIAAHRSTEAFRLLIPLQDIHKNLEQKLAEFHQREDCILYASCFDANAGLFEVSRKPKNQNQKVSAKWSENKNCGTLLSGPAGSGWCGAVWRTQPRLHHRWHPSVPSKTAALQTHGPRRSGKQAQRVTGMFMFGQQYFFIFLLLFFLTFYRSSFKIFRYGLIFMPRSLQIWCL